MGFLAGGADASLPLARQPPVVCGRPRLRGLFPRLQGGGAEPGVACESFGDNAARARRIGSGDQWLLCVDDCHDTPGREHRCRNRVLGVLAEHPDETGRQRDQRLFPERASRGLESPVSGDEIAFTLTFESTPNAFGAFEAVVAHEENRGPPERIAELPHQRPPHVGNGFRRIEGVESVAQQRE